MSGLAVPLLVLVVGHVGGVGDLNDRAADVLVVPSLWPEPYGLVGVEAARRGVPE